MNASQDRFGAAPESDDLRLKGLLRQAEEPLDLPPWFVPQLMHRVRHEGLRPADPSLTGWMRWLGWFLNPRIAVAGFLSVAAIGAWSGWRPASQQSLHLAEVRYLDVIDPVHRHP